MKKFKFLGIIAIVAIIGLSMVSCGDVFDKYGGSLEIKNNTGGEINASIINAEYLTSNNAAVTIANGKSYTWKFKLDGDVTYSWSGTDIINIILKMELLKPIKISGGEKKVITAK